MDSCLQPQEKLQMRNVQGAPSKFFTLNMIGRRKQVLSYIIRWNFLSSDNNMNRYPLTLPANETWLLLQSYSWVLLYQAVITKYHKAASTTDIVSIGWKSKIQVLVWSSSLEVLGLTCRAAFLQYIHTTFHACMGICRVQGKVLMSLLTVSIFRTLLWWLNYFPKSH